ncbi:MAG: hypothetical protein HY064_10065 [Bacteroidetes bacterium]|nr:hypothetical protein [Bacteroidota bacterium]
MNKLITRKSLGFATLLIAAFTMFAWLYPAGYFQLPMENEFIKSVKQKLSDYNKQLPEDRVYVSTDKPLYSPGETMWLSVFVRNGQTLKPSKKSDIVHVDLIDPKGAVTQTINIIANNGVAAGDFSFAKEQAGGLYKIRAYTNWMKNDGENNYFEKEFQLQQVILPKLKMKLEFEKKAFGPGDEVIAKLEVNTNENKPLSDYAIRYVSNLNGTKLLEKTESTDDSGVKIIRFNLPKDLATNDGLLNVMVDYEGSTESVSRSIPIVLNKISMNLFPEGGDLVNGMQSNVAFNALNEFGKPADVEGIVVTEKGSQVASFSSFHNGMGAFNITPQPNEKYYAKITKPEGVNEKFELPAALPNGYVMNIDNSKSGEVGVSVNSGDMEDLSLLAQVRGKIYYSTIVNAKKGLNKFIFSTENFPMGVAQITLFDAKGIARCERLAFVNKDRQMNISITTDKQKYQPREKVVMTLNVTDSKGMPVPADLSVGVVNDQLLSFANDKSGNLLSQLLLQQDVNGKIEEPAYYFDPKEADADQSLDYLLMTQGWRRFTWEKVMSDDLPAVAYQGERAVISGTVIDAYTGQPVHHAHLMINKGFTYLADTNGHFTFTKLDLSSAVTMDISASNYTSQEVQLTQYGEEQVFYLYSTNYYYKNNWGWGFGAGAAGAPRSAGRVELMDAEDAPAAKQPEEKEANVEMDRQVVLANENVVVQNAVDADQQHAQPDDKSKDVKAAMDQQVDDLRDGLFEVAADTSVIARIANGEQNNIQQMVYYRARKFSGPVYNDNENVDVRTDFRNTIYWNPDVQVDRTGRKVIEFYASDDITSFRTTAEGISSDGTAGRAEANFYTQLPFAMSTKVPVEVATEDHVSIPLTLKNNTDKPLGGVLTITSPDGLKALSVIPQAQTIMPGAAKTIYLDYEVLDKIGYGDFKISFKSCGLGDAFTQNIKIAAKGFPVNASFSSQEKEKEFSFNPKNMVKGSLKINFTAFPNVVSDLMKGVAGILQEPYGCFEQTSCTAYPNAMVLDYLNNTDSKDDKTMAYANDLLNRGYKRLTTFEAPDKGYEWFGANPGHEGLTAYGIMEFTDMKKAGGDVDQKMIDRTAAWLMSHKDGNGGFKREQHAYHNFGMISDEILNSYIVFALAEAGYTDIKKEFEASYKKAMDTKDPYELAMMANASYSLNDVAKGDDAMNALISQQAKDGSFTGKTHSITYSQGQSLTIETTSLSILAMLKASEKFGSHINSAVQFIVGSRSGDGVFSSTQGTILALKALTEYAKFSKKTNEDGTIEIYMDGNKVATKTYKAGEKGAITVDSLEQFVKGDGEHTLKVKYVNVKTPLPYSVAANWSTSLPESQSQCAVDLTTKLASAIANVGETVRLNCVLTNKKNEEIPSTMAIIGIPAGFTVQPWQLKELQDKNVFDYYEIKGNNVAIYYRGMAANAVKEINLDLKAEIPGEFDAPASSAYLYYTNEFKCWTSMNKITIRKNK